MTCSFHKYGEYFPGTGTQEDEGRSKGKGYAVIVPLKDGITDESFKSIFEPVVDKILEVFQPNAVVLQCGVDSLSGDKLVPTQGKTSLEYSAEAGTQLKTSRGHGHMKPPFGPRYRLEDVASNKEDMNIKDGSLEQVRVNALEHLQDFNSAPSVGMYYVPRECLLEFLGFGKESNTQDKLDERLAQHMRFVCKLQESDTASFSSDDESWDFLVAVANLLEPPCPGIYLSISNCDYKQISPPIAISALIARTNPLSLLRPMATSGARKFVHMLLPRNSLYARFGPGTATGLTPSLSTMHLHRGEGAVSND
ncbi:hypothetical protein ARMGADRAFT_1089520 [Armillaria gallica]|uniref:Histone deacetylase domain-containing protein n=1 Tax=Armillaria gallica TaxID=47427 RepID=A0A2H3CJZ3_ARMGA|nr:hypothetical protein ARMGADRAFT_1089520 [Armillaria gallica]